LGSGLGRRLERFGQQAGSTGRVGGGLLNTLMYPEEISEKSQHNLDFFCYPASLSFYDSGDIC
jgi:hypothetical protein